MNKETKKIINFISTNNIYKKKVENIHQRNSKDFSNQVLYVIMELVSKEKECFGMNRNKIDVNAISQEFFV